MDERSQLLSPAVVAARLSIRVATLARWRWLQIGPPYLRIGGRVRYHAADIDAWLRTRRVQRPRHRRDEGRR